MSNGALTKWRIALDTSQLDEDLAVKLVAGIQKVAPQSTLMAVPAIAASYAALVKKSTALTTCSAAVVEDQTQLSADLTARATAFSALLLELLGLKSLVTSNAASANDVAGMGFLLMTATPMTRTRPAAPALLIVKPGQEHGKARVTVYETGTIHGHYVAEVSGDPIGTWTSLPGNGKQRSLSGYPTGTKLWVHFAQVRFGLQSDWSAPVMVVIP